MLINYLSHSHNSICSNISSIISPNGNLKIKLEHKIKCLFKQVLELRAPFPGRQ